jgi:hypothetical protein
VTDTFRELCAELADSVELLLEMRAVDAKPMAITEDRLSRARTALSQPEPQGASGEALVNFTAWFCRNYPGPDTIIHKPEWHAPKVFRAAADALARSGRPAIEPVVEVATPGEDYHEDLGPVLWWRFPVDEPPWCGSPNDSDWPGYHTHFTQLPAVPTLPVPQQEVE